jgi:hypothetical protein
LQAPLAFDLDEAETLFSMRARAPNQATANAQMDAVVAAGPGTIVPASVSVDRYVSITVTANGIHVVSSLPERFADYRILVDGIMAADKATGFNAQESSPGSGWTTITTVLPASLIGSNSVITLEQTGAEFGIEAHDEIQL